LASYETILYEVSDGIATLTLNRPEVLNAYTLVMGDELVRAFGRARDDSSVRSVILTGAGRGFCSGVDLEWLRAHRAGDATGGRTLGEEAFVQSFPLELASFPKPIVVAINGAAVGVGMTMTLPCDIRLAAAGAKLGLTFTKLGILPGLGSTHLLPRLVGLGRALELVLTARVVRAEEAAAMGLVNRVVPRDELAAVARETAGWIAECAPDALARAKRALHYGAGATLEQAMRNEANESEMLRRERAGE
jgi:2-(1,2-epoxy-1,2-dihydrophenyl)acetyl-CoA isomerase